MDSVLLIIISLAWSNPLARSMIRGKTTKTRGATAKIVVHTLDIEFLMHHIFLKMYVTPYTISIIDSYVIALFFFLQLLQDLVIPTPTDK